MDVLAVIPARGGSKGVPGKNLKAIGGTPLLARAIRAAREAGLGDVAVSTDDDAIAEAARAEGAQIVRRPASISGDDASSEAALLHALESFAAMGRAPAILAFLQCTTPFFDGDDIRAVVEAVSLGGFDCAFSATPDHGFLWRVGETGAAEGINHDHTAPRRRRQDLAPQYRENGAIYAMRVDRFRETGSRFCGRVALVPRSIPPIEIDGADDLAVAEAYAAAKR